MKTCSRIEECASQVEQGSTISEIVEELHQDGLTITESIKIIREVFHISLGDAKRTVSANPVWLGVVEASKPIQDAFIDSLKRDS